MADKPLDLIRSLASSYPEAEKTFLFGDHEVYRVRKKVFVWLGDGESGGTYLGLKLKESQHAAMTLPFVKPMAYGMAKWGWVSVDFPKGKFSLPLVKEWIAESYRYTAPKKLLKQLDLSTESNLGANGDGRSRRPRHPMPKGCPMPTARDATSRMTSSGESRARNSTKPIKSVFRSSSTRTDT